MLEALFRAQIGTLHRECQHFGFDLGAFQDILEEFLLAICLILEFWIYHLILFQDEIHRVISSDTPDQITQFTSLNPSLTRSSASNTPSLTNLSDNSAGLTANDTTHRDHHIGRYHRVGKNLAVVFDDTEGTEYSIGANVDV